MTVARSCTKTCHSVIAEKPSKEPRNCKKLSFTTTNWPAGNLSKNNKRFIQKITSSENNKRLIESRSQRLNTVMCASMK